VTYSEGKGELIEAIQGVLDNSINLLYDRMEMPHLRVDAGFDDINWPDCEVTVTWLIA
jgi:hypothetical protein